ncbi:MAG: sulfotransferase [Amylibacter sp.]
MADAQKFVKVFGERNTGTRAIIRMLSAQPEVRMQPVGEVGALNLPENSDLRAKIDATYKGNWRKIYHDAVRDNEQAQACPTKAWKHARPVWDDAYRHKQAHVIFCVRNPYSWALSLFRRPYHQKGPTSKQMRDFVVQPWLTVSRDNMPAVLNSPIELWTGKVAAYRKFMEQADIPVKAIRFEGFVASPDVELRRILAELGVPFGDILRIPASTKKPSRTLEEISEYYSREDWKKYLTSDVVGAINALIDWELAAQYGYYPLNPKDFPTRFTLKNSSRSHNLTMRSDSR